MKSRERKSTGEFVVNLNQDDYKTPHNSGAQKGRRTKAAALAGMSSAGRKRRRAESPNRGHREGLARSWEAKGCGKGAVSRGEGALGSKPITLRTSETGNGFHFSQPQQRRQ